MIDVAVATDRTYLPWCATTMLSCREATTDAEVRFHALVADDVSLPDRERLARAAGSVSFIDIAGASFNGDPPGGRASWVRTMLPDLLPNLDRVVYLDSDTLVRRSVLPLRDALAGRPIAAVTNPTHPAMYPHLRSLGFKDPTEYFNSGVLVMGLDAWRSEGCSARLATVAHSRSLPWPDQDALNVVFAGRWTRLHPVWNAMNGLWAWGGYASALFSSEELEVARTDPAILHFEGPAYVKPWHYLNQHPFLDDYRFALAQTPWASEPVHGRTVGTRLIALLPKDRRLRTYEASRRASGRARQLPASAGRRAINVYARARAKILKRDP